VVDTITDHPSWEQLRAYGQGLLPPDSASALEEHLAGCASCCELLEKAPADNFLDRLKEARTPGPAQPGATTAAEVPAIPKELVDHPRYHVWDLVGLGGMGAVYRAEHRRMHRLVALKVINSDLMLRPEAVQRFHREVRAAARLDHPNIVRAFDADEAGGLHFLVMEYVEGTSLARLVRERGPLPVAEACEVVRQAALGLQHAHECGLVHRDIKPHNLMRAPDGTVKILDFGLARLSSASDGPPGGGTPAGSLTGAGTVMGTADYIAPEQAADPRDADIRADLYSLGCTLFHLLTGRPPFPDGTIRDKLARHADTPLPPLTRLCPDEVPPGLVTVLAHMTAKAPDDRYATPAEVAEALAPFCPAKAARVGRTRRLRLAVGLALLAVALLGAGLLAAVGIYLRIRTDRGEVVVQIDVTGTAPATHKSPETGRRADEQPQTGRKTEATAREAPAPTPEEAEDRAAEALRKLGGQVTRLEQSPGRPVISVNLAGVKLTDADLRPLTACPHLQTLDLSRTSVTDAGLAHLTDCIHLMNLNLTFTRVTNAGMKSVAQLKRLQTLDLSYTPVGDAGMEHLAGLSRLHTLRLYGPRVTDASLAVIGNFTDLTTLHLDDTEVTDAGVKHLAGLAELTSLRLTSARKVGDEGMKTVARLTKLQSLDIFGTSVTGQGMKELAGLGQLTSLSLGRLKGTDAGLRALAGLSKIHNLELSYTDITDEGMKDVAKHPRLIGLNLHSAKNVTDAGVKELAGLQQLRSLHLSGTQVADAGVKALGGLPRLQFLTLSETGVGDAGIVALAGCPRVTTLILGKKNKVTDAGVQQLQAALPQLRIQR
jgi:Leucine-rich repeat (LRR) protein